MIEKLENNEQVLLMYLAGELPAEDHQEVDQMLRSDPSLRRELDNLEAAFDGMHQTLARLDEVSPLPVSVEFATRRVGRDIRQWFVRPATAPVAARPAQAARSWRWLYPTVAAASIAVIAMVWLANQAGPPATPMQSGFTLPRMPGARTYSMQMVDADADASMLIESFQTPPLDSDAAVSRPVPSATEGSTPVGDSKQVALNAPDVIPQDEISQYLLSATGE